VRPVWPVHVHTLASVAGAAGAWFIWTQIYCSDTDEQCSTLSSITHLLVFLRGCLCNIEVILKFRLKCLILGVYTGVYTCFYKVGNWHREAFQEFEEALKVDFEVYILQG